MNVEIGAEAVLFPENEYISGIFVAVWRPPRNKLNATGCQTVDQYQYCIAGRQLHDKFSCASGPIQCKTNLANANPSNTIQWSGPISWDSPFKWCKRDKKEINVLIAIVSYKKLIFETFCNYNYSSTLKTVRIFTLFNYYDARLI